MPTIEGSMQGRRQGTYLVEAENKTEARKKLSQSPHFWNNFLTPCLGKKYNRIMSIQFTDSQPNLFFP